MKIVILKKNTPKVEMQPSLTWLQNAQKKLIMIHAWKYLDTFDVELFCQVVAFSSFLNSLLIERKLTLSKQIGNFPIILNHLCLALPVCPGKSKFFFQISL